MRESGTAANWDQSVASLLPAGGDVLVRVRFSALNYKDALALTGRGKVLRHFPIVPGVDLAGEVVESSDARFAAGDAVFATGMGIGEDRSGGFAQFARVCADAVRQLPDGLSFEDVMGLGTAGFTAMLCVLALEDHGLRADNGDVLVMGAGGGVGGFAVSLLAARGYRVTALTGRTSEAEYLRSLGAREIIDRNTLSTPGRPLVSARWSGAVDTVGGQILANVLAAIKHGGSVAACGNAGGTGLPATVFPFILRGVNLLGIEAVHCPPSLRDRAWAALAVNPPREALRAMCRIEPMQAALKLADDMLAGRIRGRVVLRVP